MILFFLIGRLFHVYFVFRGGGQWLSLKEQVLIFPRTLMVSREGLDHAKSLISGYKQGKFRDMNLELWSAKKIVDSTLHPGMPGRLLNHWVYTHDL